MDKIRYSGRKPDRLSEPAVPHQRKPTSVCEAVWLNQRQGADRRVGSGSRWGHCCQMSSVVEDTQSRGTPTHDSSDVSHAQFEIELSLPEPANLGDVVWQVGRAIRREYEGASVWKRLLCSSVRRLDGSAVRRETEGEVESKVGTIFELTCGHTIEFDWGWEGATAFTPVQLALGEENDDEFSDVAADPSGEVSDLILWRGEVVHVDATGGRLFVCVSDPRHPPSKGSFYVRPFDFLETLRRLYDNGFDRGFDRLRQLCAARLNAARGGVHPRLEGAGRVGLLHLHDWWLHFWCHLWGPPGTGKTFTTGRQVASVLEDPNERVLVVSTTNKATNVAAISIGKAAREFGRPELPDEQMLRIGKGATLSDFQRADLASMLAGTETAALEEIEALHVRSRASDTSEERAQIQAELNQIRRLMSDFATRNFLDAENRVVVATAFRAMAFLASDDIRNPLEHGSAPFTTIFIDEAGLISRAATAALSLLASRRVVLAGDSKQLAPISQVHRVLPHDQRRWLRVRRRTGWHCPDLQRWPGCQSAEEASRPLDRL